MSCALPHIAILMGTRNGAAHLPAQLASIAAQDHGNWSLWVSDDGSTDATRTVLRNFAKTRTNPVILCDGPQQGTTANYLSLLCHPDLPPGPVAFADQDDLWLPHHLARGVGALTGAGATPAGQAYVASRLAVRADLTPRPLPLRRTRPPGFANAMVENLLPGNALMLDAAAVALARRAGPVAAPFWDWWLYLLLSGAGTEILQDARPGLMYRAHGANQIGPRQGIGAALWRLGRVVDGTYQDWIWANLAALEPHKALLNSTSRAALEPLLTLSPRHRLRRLSAYRQWPRDRLALWLAA